MFAFLLASECFYRIVWKKPRRFTFLENYTEKWKIYMLFKATLTPFRKRIVTINFDALRPSATLLRWAFSSKVDTHRISVDGRKRIKIKTATEHILGACVGSMPKEFQLQFYLFRTVSWGQSKTHQTVVWTQINRWVFCGNENEYLWKRVSVN